MSETFFLRFCVDSRDTLEWGFHVLSGYIPAIGDTVMLEHGLPDEEADAAVLALVTQRHFPFFEDFPKWYEIEFTVELYSAVPEDHIAHSDAWPSTEVSKREAELQEDLERIRTSKPTEANRPPAP